VEGDYVYFVTNNQLWQISKEDRERLLRGFAGQKDANFIVFDPKAQGAVSISDGPIEVWENMNPAMAEAYLMGMPTAKAIEVGYVRRELAAYDAGMARYADSGDSEEELEAERVHPEEG
jgi:hypothetical protein